MADEHTKTLREDKLQEIFNSLGSIQYNLVLSPELISYHDDPNITAVYNKIEEARELLRKV